MGYGEGASGEVSIFRLGSIVVYGRSCKILGLGRSIEEEVGEVRV